MQAIVCVINNLSNTISD